MRIKRKSIAMKPIEGGIVDTINVQNKVKNAPSINLVQNMTGIPTEVIIAFDGTEDCGTSRQTFGICQMGWKRCYSLG